jgi:hypothetical protein
MSKDLLFLTNLKFNLVKKDRWFYGRFEYCMGFSLAEVNCLRMLDHAHIDEMIERRKEWRKTAQQRWIKRPQNQFAVLGLGRNWKPITESTVNNLHLLADLLLTATVDFKLVVSTNQAYVYTNDQDLIDRLNGLNSLTHKTFTQAQIARPKNTIQLKDPKHKLRSYFKLCKLTGQQKDQLGMFLLSQQSHVRLSPALLKWIDHPFNRTQDYFFVDYDTETWLTMLNLVQSGIVRKTMHIISAK